MSGIDPRVSEEDLEYFFEQIGEVRKVLITEEQDQEGFLQASVTYNTPEDAKMAYDLCNGSRGRHRQDWGCHYPSLESGD